MPKRKGQTTPPGASRGIRAPDGEFFGSPPEYNYWLHLRAEEAAGRIRGLKRRKGAQWPIVINGITIGHYTADALYQTCIETAPGRAEWVTIIVDVKGFADRKSWPFRKKVIEAACGITITEVPASEWSDATCAKRRQAALQESMAL